MPPGTFDRETESRLTRLEAEMDNIENTMKKVESKVDTLHDALVGAKGAKWALYAMFAFIGFAASLLTKLVH